MSEILKEDWDSWKRSGVTKHLVASLLNKRQMLMEGIAEGTIPSSDIDLTIGRCQSLKDTVMYIIEDFDYLERDAEPNA